MAGFSSNGRGTASRAPERRGNGPYRALPGFVSGGIRAHPRHRMMVTIFSLQCPARFHRGVGYEHSTDRFRSAQTSRTDAAGSPPGADGFRPAPSLRADAAGSPGKRRLGPHSRAGGTRFSSRQPATRQPSCTGTGTRGQPSCTGTGTRGQPSGAGTGARGHRSRRRLLRLAQEVVRRLKPAPPGPLAGSAVRREVSALRGRSKAAPEAPSVLAPHRELRPRHPRSPAPEPSGRAAAPFRSRGAVHRIREGVSAAARASIPFCPPHGREHARPEDREGAGQNVHGAVEALADERPERHRDQGGE